MSAWWDLVWPIAASASAGLLVLWLALLLWLCMAGPDAITLREAARLLPQMVQLLRRLAGDRVLSRAVRMRLALLLAYLAMPVDLVPDFIPVLGYADDAIVVALALRSVVRAAGPAALQRHWQGTSEGLAAVRRLAGA